MTDAKGFAAPLDPAGTASLYGAGPWRFAGHSATVFARCDAAAVRALLPPPLEPWGEPIVRFSVHWLQCDLGFGGDFATANPERAATSSDTGIRSCGAIPMPRSRSAARCTVGRNAQARSR